MYIFSFVQSSKFVLPISKCEIYGLTLYELSNFISEPLKCYVRAFELVIHDMTRPIYFRVNLPKHSQSEHLFNIGFVNIHILLGQAGLTRTYNA